MKVLTLRDALDEYKNIYMAYRNFAERTREEYQNDLENLIKFLEKAGITKIKQLRLQTIERYGAELEKRGLASLTRKRKVVTIRSFLMFLYRENYIASNIAKWIVLPFTDNTTPKFLTQTECDHLRNACLKDPRDKAIIELLLQTGIKLSELIGLNVDDLDFANDGDSGLIRLVGGRGTKSRLIKMNNQACIALKDYLHVRGNIQHEKLFLNRFGEALGERGVQKILKTYFKIAGIQRASVHTLRHTFGIHQLSLGASPRTIKEVMGYRDSRSISIYTEVAKYGRQKIIQK